jgi:hypothetical protein
MNKIIRAFYAFNGISLVKFTARVFFLVPVLVIALLLLINVFFHDPGSLFYTAMTVSAITPFLVLVNARQCISDEVPSGEKYFRSMVHVRKQFVRAFHFQWLLGWICVIWYIVLYYCALKYLSHTENTMTVDSMIFAVAQMTVIISCIPFSLIAKPLYAEFILYISMVGFFMMPLALPVRLPYDRILVLFIAAAVLAFVSDTILMRILFRELVSGRDGIC